MKTHVLRGSKQQIAEDLARINGEVREAIVFLDEPAPPATGAATHESEDIFAEMRPFMVDEDGVDDLRRGDLYANGRRMILLDTNLPITVLDPSTL